MSTSRARLLLALMMCVVVGDSIAHDTPRTELRQAGRLSVPVLPPVGRPLRNACLRLCSSAYDGAFSERSDDMSDGDAEVAVAELAAPRESRFGSQKEGR